MPKKRLRSGDRLADEFFHLAIVALNDVVERIGWTHDLYWPDHRGIDLDGLYQDDVIYLDSKMMPFPKTARRILFHEALHAIFNDLGKEEEAIVTRLQRLCWEEFTEQQKSTLQSYLPPKNRILKQPR